jgi:hypothetical protein
MDFEGPTRDARGQRARGLRAGLRGWLVAGLLACVVVVGVGGVLLASALSRPTAAPPGVSRPMVVTLYDGSHSHTPPTSLPTATPRPCQCTAHPIEVPHPPSGVPSGSQYIVVSISKQWLWAYQDGKQVFNTPVTTGRPELPTPTGYFSVQEKLYNVWFYSPWPPSSPYYYSPEHVNYAMLFAAGGYFLHDASWRYLFGPGSNVPHKLPNGSTETGSHGCVNLPVPAAAWLINWVWVGTTVRIEG